MNASAFQKALLDWFDHSGRKTLPWQRHKNHYRVWVSEIMLQQTQVATVIPYFERFIARFPDLETLATAPLDAVLSHWSGLGYYARARNLHRAANIILQEHQGQFPSQLTAAMALPGLGRSTASAILALVEAQPLPILDGNVKRVLSRFHAVSGAPDEPKTLQTLWALADQYMPSTRVADYTQAMMDLGALICTRANPACLLCPLEKSCIARHQNQVAQYPVPKKQKAKPEKHLYFVCLIHQKDQLFLIQRPLQGIWGGSGVFRHLSI